MCVCRQDGERRCSDLIGRPDRVGRIVAARPELEVVPQLNGKWCELRQVDLAQIEAWKGTHAWLHQVFQVVRAWDRVTDISEQRLEALLDSLLGVKACCVVRA